MDQVLLDFITALRGSGVRVSISENMDAMNAARLNGYDDKQLLKDSLAATLAKSRREKDLFEDCFERFFSGDQAFITQHDPHESSPPEITTEISQLSHMLLSGDETGLSLSIRESAKEVGITDIWFFTQKGLYIQRILRAMGMEGLNQDIRRLAGENSEPAGQTANELKEAKNRLFENVRDFVEKQFSLFAGSATEKIIEKYLRDVRLSNLEQRDFHRMHAIIRKMVKRLNARHSRKRKTSKKGSLDLKKTLRANVAYQGIILDPKWKSKKIDKPDIMVLCDISRSVEKVARFMLLFLYGLNEAVARIRSFIFCSNLVEVSSVFEEYPVEEAVLKLQRGSELGVHLGRTDYGQALLDFKDSFLDAVTNKTTVLVLGDARNNHNDPRTDILRLIRDRCKRLVWLNPEPPSFWGTGDSEMQKYTPCCLLAKECSTITHLERVVDFLLKTQD